MSPFDCSDLPNDDNPWDVTFNRVIENTKSSKTVCWGWHLQKCYHVRINVVEHICLLVKQLRVDIVCFCELRPAIAQAASLCSCAFR